MFPPYFLQFRFLSICHRLSPRAFCLAQSFRVRSIALSSSLSSSVIAPKGAGKAAIPGKVYASHWTCPKCSFRNFPRNSSCRRCSHIKGNVSATKALFVNNLWPCSGCKSINDIGTTTCKQCGMVKPEGIHSLRGETAADGSWFCTNCEFPNYPIRDTCFRCETMVSEKQRYDVLQRSEIWECGICGNKNYPRRNECNGCKTARDVK